MSRTSHAAAARPALNPSRAALAALAALDADAEHEASLAIKRTLSSVAEAGVHKPAGVPCSVFDF